MAFNQLLHTVLALFVFFTCLPVGMVAALPSAVLYSSATPEEPVGNQTARTVVGIIIFCIAGGLFLAAATQFLVRWAHSVLQRRTQKQNVTTDLEANTEQDGTTSTNSSATMINSTIRTTTTPKNKKREGMVIDTTQFFRLAEQDNAGKISTTTKDMADLAPCLSPLAPMSPFLVFDVVQQKAEIATVEKQKQRHAAYLQLTGQEA